MYLSKVRTFKLGEQKIDFSILKTAFQGKDGMSIVSGRHSCIFLG
jgi:hypothetical protein